MIRFCILDHDARYAGALADFMGVRYGSQVEPYLFHSLDSLRDYLQEHRPDLILASDTMLPDPSVLGERTVAYLTEERTLERLNGRPAIFRYQSGERLLRHAENTAGLLHYPTGALDMVRAGIGLYGYAPAGMAAPIPLTPILTLAAPLVSVKKVPAGTPIGYGGTYVTARETTVGILPLGYADGIPRLAGAHGCRVSRGEKTAPVIGRVCMDQTLLDLTECGGSIGDTVTVYGSTPGVRLTDWAERLGAIPYELLTAIGARVRRIYK